MARQTPNKSTRKMRANHKASTAKPEALRIKSNQEVAGFGTSEPSAKKRWQRTPKAEQPSYPKLPNVFRITRKTYDLLVINWKLLLGIAVVYGVLNLLLVRGFNGGLDVRELKAELTQLYDGGWSNLAAGATIFSLLVSSSNSSSTSNTAGGYQLFLVLTTSLALVWSFRQLLANRIAKIRIRDSFYQGMYPLVPVLAVLLVISLQLIPALIGGAVYSLVVSNGIAVTTSEIIGWFLFFLVMITVSLLLITPSVLALYIVSLPNMTPIKALRSAKQLVKFRRGTVLRKLLFLPLLILGLLCVIMLPVILFIAVAAQWIFLALSILILPAVHGYMYTLYRELLHE